MEPLLEILIDTYDVINKKNKSKVLNKIINKIKDINTINDENEYRIELLNKFVNLVKEYKTNQPKNNVNFLKDLLLNIIRTYDINILPLRIQLDLRVINNMHDNHNITLLINIIQPIYQLLLSDSLSSSLTLPIKEMFDNINNYLMEEEKELLNREIKRLTEIFIKQGWNGTHFDNEPCKHILIKEINSLISK